MVGLNVVRNSPDVVDNDKIESIQLPRGLDSFASIAEEIRQDRSHKNRQSGTSGNFGFKDGLLVAVDDFIRTTKTGSNTLDNEDYFR